MSVTYEQELREKANAVLRYINDSSITIKSLKELYGEKIYRWLEDHKVHEKISEMEKLSIPEIRERIKKRRTNGYPIEKRIDAVRRYINDHENKITITTLEMSYGSFEKWMKDPKVLEGVAELEGCNLSDVMYRLEERRENSRVRAREKRRKNFHFTTPDENYLKPNYKMI